MRTVNLQKTVLGRSLMRFQIGLNLSQLEDDPERLPTVFSDQSFSVDQGNIRVVFNAPDELADIQVRSL